jgi:hypothetical protein
MRIMRHLYLILIFLISLPDSTTGQSLYLSKVAVNTGAVTLMNRLPGVSSVQTQPRYTHFNTRRKAYVFLGTDPSGNKRLYTIDVSNGQILAAPQFPVNNGLDEVISELVHNNITDSIYATCWNHKEGRQYLIAIDPVSGQYRYLKEISNIVAVVFNTGNLDPVQHQYSFVGLSSSGNPQYVTVDINSLTVTQVPLAAGNYNNLFTINADTALFLHPATDGKIVLQSLNRNTGSVQTISNLFPIKSLDNTDNTVNYDGQQHTFIFCGYDATQQKRLYIVDAFSGAITGNVAFPPLQHIEDKLLQFKPDPETGEMYCLYRDSDLEQVVADSVQMGPNPFNTVLNVDVRRMVNEISYALYDIGGRKVKVAEIQQAHGFHLSRQGLHNGVYFLSVFIEKRLLGTWKIVVAD